MQRKAGSDVFQPEGRLRIHNESWVSPSLLKLVGPGTFAMISVMPKIVVLAEVKLYSVLSHCLHHVTNNVYPYFLFSPKTG